MLWVASGPDLRAPANRAPIREAARHAENRARFFGSAELYALRPAGLVLVARVDRAGKVKPC